MRILEKGKDFKDALRNQLHVLFPEAKDMASNTEVAINCPLCNAEGKTDHDRHMYISLGYNGKPPMYNCFRNIEHRGLLTKSSLEQLVEQSEYIDPEIMNELENEIKKSSNSRAYRLNRSKNFMIINPLANISPKSKIKLDYINNRLGLNLTYQDLVDKKIVLNLYDLLSYNHITTLTRSKYIADYLDEYFLGFLSNNNSTLIMRNLVNKDKINILPERLRERYTNYNVVPLNGIPTGYYTIPCTCNLYEHIDVHIAEGAFDLLSVYYNLCGQNNINNVYCCIGGNTYLNVMKYYLVDIGLMDVDFYIYIDNDITRNTLDSIKRVMFPLEEALDINIYIAMNTYPNEKDFGVNPNHINKYIYKL